MSEESEEFNNLENETTSLCTFLQDDSYEINFQKVKEIQVNVYSTNGNNNLEENHIQEINDNNINNNEASAHAINGNNYLEESHNQEINANNINNDEVNALTNGNLNLEESQIQEMNFNGINNVHNEEEIIDSGFQLDINSNYLNQKDN